MRILVNLENTEDFRDIFVEENEPIESLKYIIEAEFCIPFAEQELKFENKVLANDSLSLRDFKVKEEDVLIVAKRKISTGTHQGQGQGNQYININSNLPLSSASNSLNANTSSGQGNNSNLSKIFEDTMKMLKQGGGNTAQNNPLGFNMNTMNTQNNQNLIENRIHSECRHLKEFYTNKPDELNMLFNTDPDLAEVIVSMDDKKLEDLIRTRINKYEEKRRKDNAEYFKLMNADPNDAEAQRKIEEMIRWKNIDENLKMAQEYLPETFLPVHMLFINIEINKHNVVALVDTGAQSTIVSEDLAKKLGVFNLCDTRYSGIAKGVGTSKIIGVIHAAQMKIGNR
jgi:DNA damage-inducible protein 1